MSEWLPDYDMTVLSAKFSDNPKAVVCNLGEHNSQLLRAHVE